MQDNNPPPANDNCCTPTVLLVITVVVCMVVILVESVLLAYTYATYNNRKEIEIQLAEHKIRGEASANATLLARCLQDVIDLEIKLENNTVAFSMKTNNEQSSATAVELSFMEDYKNCLARNNSDSNEIKRLNEKIGTEMKKKKDVNTKYKQCILNMERMAKEQSDKDMIKKALDEFDQDED